MPGAAYKTCGQFTQWLHVNVVGRTQHIGIADDGVDGLVAQGLQQGAGGAALGAHLDARVGLRHVDQERRQQQRRRRGRHPDRQRAFLGAAQQVQVAPQLAFFQPHAARAFGHQLAEHRQARAPRAAVKERRLEFVFQRADAAAQRRLGQVHGACGLGEGAVLDDG
ncbi:hypothetical protein D3C72_1685990 [compost metagenome]